MGIARLDVRLCARQILFLSLSGAIGLALGDTFLFRAFREIGARITMLVMLLAPAIAATISYWVLDERLSAKGVLGIVVTVAGIAVVVSERNRQPSSGSVYSISGIALAVAAAVCQGAGLVVAKMAFHEGDVNGFVATTVRITAALMLLLPVAALAHRFVGPRALYRTDRTAFLYAAIGSVLGPFLGISFSLIAIEHTDVGIAATIMATVPVLMLPLVRLIYKEYISQRAVLGTCVAVGGVALLFWR
ncbi:MAG: hypothetical protein C4326_13820 [Ignavibacteria bacterium]